MRFGLVDTAVFLIMGSWFGGTSRDAALTPASDGSIVPFYSQIDQFGIDVQATVDAWLWKLEALQRNFDQSVLPDQTDYWAMVGGFEYTFYGVKDGLYDLGLLLEYHYDDRSSPETVVFQNDLFSAVRLGFTDAESSELLAGVLVDMDDQTSSFRVAGNRRVFGDARISLEAQSFFNVDDNNASAHLVDSDFVKLSLEWFF